MVISCQYDIFKDAGYNALANKSVSQCDFGLGQSNQGQSHFEDSHGKSILVFNDYQPVTASKFIITFPMKA